MSFSCDKDLVKLILSEANLTNAMVRIFQFKSNIFWKYFRCFFFAINLNFKPEVR